MEPPIAGRPLARLGAELVTVSFVVLFQELALIRWLPTQVRVLAFFPNLILLSAFLGLGLGCLLSGRRWRPWLWPASLLLVTGAGWALSRVAFTQNSPSEHLWLLYFDLGATAPVFGDVRLPIVLCFVLSAVSFVPPGQLVADRLQEFRARARPLAGYACDLLGSLLGVAAFAGVSFLAARPPLWFAIPLLAGAVFYGASRRRLLAYSAGALAVIAIARFADHAMWYSPYYALSALPDPAQRSINIMANGSLHQVAFPVRQPSPDPAATSAGYHLPYRLLRHPPARVLVLGAGTGNDVAVALGEGAAHVDAVEIDPVILGLGRRHPDRPYASDRVRLVNTDARAFLNESTEKYDLIVFGTLDSMTRLSALSNVRLDNFVYTAECLAAARRHLAADGGVVLFFMVGEPYIAQRLEGLLTDAFGQAPFVVSRPYSLFNQIYFGGPAFDHVAAPERQARLLQLQRQARPGFELPTDDWPYLYLQGRTVSSFYLLIIAVLALLAVGSVAWVSGAMRRSLLRGAVDGEMFLFGLAFLLLETKSVTTMSLLWGATWLTSAVVFGSILAMVLAATLLVQWRPLPWILCIAGLILSLVATYEVPVHVLLRMNEGTRLLLSLAFVGTPIFFAAACFALLFRDRPEANTAFGWNLLGAVAGGLIEFASMITGLRALSLLVLVAYLGVVWIRIRRDRRPRGSPAAA